MSADGIVSTPQGSLFAALAKAQSKIKHAVKDSKNPHFNSRYADLAAVAEACREALTENGICVIQDPYTDGPQVVCVTTLGHASGERFESRPLRMAPQDLKPQTVGSCVTYLRRYQLAAIVGVAPDDDDGNAAQGLPPKGDRGSVAPAASASTHGDTGGTLSHPQRTTANLIEHDGTFAEREQVDELIELRRQLGIEACQGDCGKAVKKVGKWGKEKEGVVFCKYHEQLARFRDQHGHPIRNADGLGKKQIAFLISRYKEQVAKKTAVASEPPDIGAVIPDVVDIRTKLAAATDSDHAFADAEREICARFGVDKITDITDKGDKLTALSLVTAYAMGPEAFEKAMAEARL